MSTIDLLCEARACLVHTGGVRDLTAWDYGHLSRTGSVWLEQRLVQSPPFKD